MNTYFDVIEDIKTLAQAEPFINTVSSGDISEVNLDKTTIFPLCHISIDNVELSPRLSNLRVSMILMDIVDISKESNTDAIRGNNNEMDVLNTQLAVASRIQSLLERTSTHKDSYQLEGTFSCAPFSERFEANLAGWNVEFNVSVQNPMTSC